MLPELELSSASEKAQVALKALGKSLGQTLGESGTRHQTDAGQELTYILEASWVYVTSGYLKVEMAGSTLCVVSPAEFFRVPPECEKRDLNVIGDFAADLMVWDESQLQAALAQDSVALKVFIRYQASYVDALEALCGELAGGEIRPALRFAVFQPGDVILEQGSPAMYVGVMARGHAVVKVDGAVVGEIRSGELFGEMSFLTGQNRTASVEATKVCECQFTTHQDFARLIQARPSLMIDVAGQMARRIFDLDVLHAKA